MPGLYDVLRLGALTLPNRILMAPLTRSRSPNAVPPAIAADYYRQRASAGLIISEATAISQQAQGYMDVPGLYAPEQIASWKKVTAAVHEAGGRIISQLWHVGRISHNALQPGGGPPVAPSAIQAKAQVVLERDGKAERVPATTPRALETHEIPGIVADYRRAAAAAREAGFDGVEVHAANGYLLEQFLKSGTNHRTDAYGGPVAQRARLLVDVMAAVAGEVGPERTGVRLSPNSTFNDATEADPQTLYNHVLQQLGPLGLAYVHLILGTAGGPAYPPDSPFDYERARAAYSNAGGQGRWILNNGFTRATAEAALAAGSADAIAFGRPFIANPDLVERFRRDGPYNPDDHTTWYGGGAKGYTDYPTLAAAH